MNRLLLRSSSRFYLRHPWQLALAIAGISLGVAVYVGVALANDSAGRAFELSSALLRGQTTHRLLPVSGDLDESVYRELVVDRGLTAAAPVIEADIEILAGTGGRYPLLGIDPLQESAVRRFSAFAAGGRASPMAALISTPNSVLIPEELAHSLGVSAGASLPVAARGRQTTVKVLGTVPTLAGDVRAEPPILADIATAQELLGTPGVLSRIDLKLTREQAARLGANPPPGTVLVPAEEPRSSFAELSGAFSTNLTALGLLALVVGMFLIYGTMSFAVVQRRATLGVLSALGVSARQVLGTILLEASVLGVLATALGLLIGRLLAHGLVTLMLRTIGDLYFTATVMAAAPSPRTYVVGVVLGLGATLVAALKPSLDAARATPAAAMRRAELERQARRGARRAGLWALPVLAAAAIVLGIDSHDLYVAFGGLFLVLAAGALLTPVITVALMRISERPARALFKLPGLLAVRGVAASLSRTGVATSALAVAVATVVGIGLMIGSFRSSFTAWLHTTLTSDLYVAFDPSGRSIDDDMLRSLAAIPGVADISLTRNALVPTAKGDVAVRAVRPGAGGWGLDLTTGRADEALAELGAGKGVVVSERFAFGRGLRVGDALTLPTKHGAKAFPILGVFRDYNTGQYTAVMALAAYRRDWEDSKLTGLGLRLSRADAADVEARIRKLLGPGLRVRSTAAIEQISLQIFDRTFRITEVLRILAALVAFFGVLSALLSIELERAHELAVLRALGFGPGQLTVTLLTQTGLLGAAAGVAAVPLGTALAGLLVYVINERSFGWTMELKLTAAPIAAGLLLAVAAAVVAGIYPAVRAARVELGGALREE